MANLPLLGYHKLLFEPTWLPKSPDKITIFLPGILSICTYMQLSSEYTEEYTSMTDTVHFGHKISNEIRFIISSYSKQDL